MTTTSSQVLLTFLINAGWQIALVAAFASFSSWLLRNSAARYRHWIWVAALFLSLGVPLTTSFQPSANAVFKSSATFATHNTADIQPVLPFEKKIASANELPLSSDAFLLSRTLGVLLISAYLLVVFYSASRLLKAWHVTRRLKRSAISLSDSLAVEQIVEGCCSAIGVDVDKVQVCSSDTVDVPFTLGALRPVIVVPQQLLSESDGEVLTSALGHELIHIKRRDYAFNLVYELFYLLLSFHPAAALIRRRIRQTRELSCDELVAERILNAEVYARSLVQLASSAPTLRRLSVTTTVGIADADILEARVMSLLKKSKLDTRRKRMVLLGLSLLLLVPCLAAAAVAMKFDLQPVAAAVQDPVQQDKERKEREQGELSRVKIEGEKFRVMRDKIEEDPAFREEILRKQAIELQMRTLRQAALAKVARISMDQAIQIATSQKQGTVMQCNLDASHWKEPGVLAEDAKVFYRVQIVGTDQVDNGGITHIWVNALDGSILKTEQELLRQQKRPE